MKMAVFFSVLVIQVMMVSCLAIPVDETETEIDGLEESSNINEDYSKTTEGIQSSFAGDSQTMKAKSKEIDNTLQRMIDKLNEFEENLEEINEHDLYYKKLIEDASEIFEPQAEISKNNLQTLLMHSFEKAMIEGDINFGLFIINFGVDIIHFITDVHSGKTALILASENGRLAIVKKLIELGADIEIKDFKGMSAVCYAYKNNHDNVVKELTDHGSHTRHVNRDIKESCDLAIQNMSENRGQNFPGTDENNPFGCRPGDFYYKNLTHCLNILAYPEEYKETVKQWR